MTAPNPVPPVMQNAKRSPSEFGPGCDIMSHSPRPAPSLDSLGDSGNTFNPAAPQALRGFLFAFHYPDSLLKSADFRFQEKSRAMKSAIRVIPQVRLNFYSGSAYPSSSDVSVADSPFVNQQPPYPRPKY